MKQGSYSLHSNPGGTFDCECTVDVMADGETVSMEFPQLTKPDDNIGPSVYACMDGTALKVVLTDRDDVQVAFVWMERAGRWVEVKP